MKLYKDTDIDNAKRTMDIYIADAGTDIRKHPSYIEFVRNLSEKIGEADAESFWNLMMKGFRKMYSDRDPSGFQDFAEKVGKKGVVRDPSVHKEVIEMIMEFAKSLDFVLLHLEYSPIKGPEGNIEYLLHMTKEKDREVGQVDAEAVVMASHQELA